MAALALSPQSSRILLLGLGGGAMVHYLLHYQPAARIDVVERSTMVIEAATTYFRLPTSLRLRIMQEDAQLFVTGTGLPRYDLVFIDLFGPDSMMDGLADPLFHRRLRNHLLPGALVASNLWSGNAALFRQAKEAADAAFDGHVLELPVQKRANMVLLCGHDIDPQTLIRPAKKNLPALSARYDLELPLFFKRIRRYNRGSLRSFYHLLPSRQP
jgi:spermidine synthase